MAAKKKTQATPEITQEPLKSEKTYKVTHGEFEHKNEAMTAAGEARKKGILARLIIEKEMYKLLFAEGISEAAAQAAVKRIEVAGLKVEMRKN